MNRTQLNKDRIFTLLDQLENKTGVMAHQIDVVDEYLEAWQDGQLHDLFFLNFLQKELDELNKEKNNESN